MLLPFYFILFSSPTKRKGVHSNKQKYHNTHWTRDWGWKNPYYNNNKTTKSLELTKQFSVFEVIFFLKKFVRMVISCEMFFYLFDFLFDRSLELHLHNVNSRFLNFFFPSKIIQKAIFKSKRINQHAPNQCRRGHEENNKYRQCIRLGAYLLHPSNQHRASTPPTSTCKPQSAPPLQQSEAPLVCLHP